MDAATVRSVLDDPVAQELYEQQEVARLAYTAKDGSPRVIPIGYRWDGSMFHVYTSTNAAKVRALDRDPRVALTVDTDGFPPKVLLVRGSAHCRHVDGIPDGYLETNRKRTSSEQEFDEWRSGVEALYDEMYDIEIAPHWAKILDFETRLPSAVEELAQRRAPS